MRGTKFLATVVVAMVLLSCGAEHAKADPVTIRAGWLVAPTLIFPMMPLKTDVLKHYGKSYVLDLTHFTGTPPQVTALAANEIDLSGLSYSAFALAVTNAHLDDLRIIGDGVQDGVEGWQTNDFMVLKDGPIHTVEDLKGQVIGDNAFGGALDIAIRIMLKKHGLEDKRDLSIIEIQVPNMKAALAEKKVALVAPPPPFEFDPDLRAIARPLFTQREAMGISQTVVLTARAGTLEKNRAAWIDFLEDELRFLHWMSDPATHDEAVALSASFNKQSPQTFSWIFTHQDAYRDPKGEPKLQALQTNLDMLTDIGLLKSKLVVDRYVDLSMMREAAARIK